MNNTPMLPGFEPNNLPPITNEFNQDARLVLHHGDVNDLLIQIPDNSIQLIISSPPYNIGKEYETRVALSTYLETQREILQELVRVLKPEGSICWQVGNYVEKGQIFPLDIYYYPIFLELGMQLRNRIIWHFGHGLGGKNRFSGRYETLLWFTKSDDYIFNLDDVRVPAKYPNKRSYKGEKKGQLSGNPKGTNPSDLWKFLENEWDTGVWEFPNVKSNHPEYTKHPAQFPIELVERCVLAFTNEDDFVFDPFSGSGTALLASIIHNRKAIGAEKEAEYIQITRDRLELFHHGDFSYRKIGTPLYVPPPTMKVAQYPDEWRNREGMLNIDRIYSHNDGYETLKGFPELHDEVFDLITRIDTNLCLRTETDNDQIIDRALLRVEINKTMSAKGWEPKFIGEEYNLTDGVLFDYESGKKIDYKLPSPREISFYKEPVSVEFTFGPHPYAIHHLLSTLTIFKNVGLVEVGVLIIPSFDLASRMQVGTGFIEQVVLDLQHRGTWGDDAPAVIIGVSTIPNMEK